MDRATRTPLRRLDWRFLLPMPSNGKFRHLIVAGGPPGLAERVVEAQVAETAGRQSSTPRPADALVVLYDSPYTWQQLADNLGAGGVLYCELQRSLLARLQMSPRRLRHRLRAAGLTLHGTYWVAPDFEHARRYIPLDANGAVDWYFSSLFVAGNLGFAVARQLLRAVIGKQDARMARLAPSLGIVATRGQAQGTLPAVLAHPDLRSHLPADAVRPLLVTSGQDDASRMIALPFAPGEARPPAVVIKLATQPAFNAETELEQSVQREVRDLVDGKLRRSIPQPRGVYYDHDLAIGVESFAPGHTLWVSSGGWDHSRQTKLDDLAMGAAWLTEFHAQTERSRAAWDAHALERWVEQPLRDYARLRAVSVAEENLFAQMRAHAQSLVGVEFPLVWQHHDFAPWNLYRDGENLTVIDWEGNREWEAMRVGPSLCDLIYFAHFWHGLVQRFANTDAENAAIRALWIDPAAHDRYGAAARQAVASYMDARRLDWRWLPLLVAHTWIERVVYSHGRAHKLWGDARQSAAADKFAGYVLEVARHCDALFAPDADGFWQGEWARACAREDAP